MGPNCIGIDLGTTNSVSSFIEGGIPKTIPQKNGNRILPSVIAVNKDKKIICGEVALRQKNANPQNTFSSIKRIIGRRNDETDLPSESEFQYKLDFNEEYVGVYSSRLEKRVTCEEISAHTLIEIKEASEHYLGREVNKCVITIPAYFNNNQRRATKKAAQIAGLDVLRLINEPTAAAIAYGATRKVDGTCVVADLGGGTFDLSLISNTGNTFTEVIATHGNSNLGGDNIDQAFTQYLCKRVSQEHSFNKLLPITEITIFDEARRIKHELSFNEEVQCNLPVVLTESGDMFSSEFKVTRIEFEEAIKDILITLEKEVDYFLDKSQINDIELDHLVLAGGSSRLRWYQLMLERKFKIKPTCDVNVDEIVAHGAAICAEMMDGNNDRKILMDVTPLKLGTNTLGDIFSCIIEENTTIPCSNKENYTTTEDFQRSILVEIYQGNRPISTENTLIGSFELNNIEHAQAGIPEVEIEFALDINGILTVKAKDNKTLSTNTINIRDFSGLNESVIASIRQKAIDERAVDEVALKASMVWKRIFEYVVILRRQSIQDPTLKNLMKQAESVVAIPAKESDLDTLEELSNALSKHFDC